MLGDGREVAELRLRRHHGHRRGSDGGWKGGASSSIKGLVVIYYTGIAMQR
jgi:hypothetical protein